MLWFVINMMAYVSTLVAALAVIPMVAWKLDFLSAAPESMPIVVVLAPIFCWAVALGHLKLYDHVVSVVVNLCRAVTSEVVAMSSPDSLSEAFDAILSLSAAISSSLGLSGYDLAMCHQQRDSHELVLLLQNPAFPRRVHCGYYLACNSP